MLPALVPGVALMLMVAACSDFKSDVEVRVIVDGKVVPSVPTQAPTELSHTPVPLPVQPTPPISTLDPEDLYGFIQPIGGGCLPDSGRLMPNSPREYRNGYHEGVDWYDLSSCAHVFEGTKVLAMYAGVVIRADLDYLDLTEAMIVELERRTEECGCTDSEVLDLYRGRQVWLAHGDNVVSRYAHLGSIPDGIWLGAEVTQGQIVGTVGESGTPESVRSSGTEMHLHAEVRIGDRFLGEGFQPENVRLLWERLFSAPN